MVQFSINILNFTSKSVRSLKSIARNTFDSYDMTNVLPIHENSVYIAVKLLKHGQLIALPTDTIYGIAADSQNFDAIKALYNLKGRDFTKPIAVCVSNVKEIENWGKTDGLPSGILDDLLPGPVTILLNRTSVLNQDLNPGNDKIGVRIPDSKFIREVAKTFGSAIALTSANISSEQSTLSPEEFKHLWPKLGAVFNGGKVGQFESREGSTIVDLSECNKYYIVREGSALQGTLNILHKHGLKYSV